jgi:hypothetical protein
MTASANGDDPARWRPAMQPNYFDPNAEPVWEEQVSEPDPVAEYVPQHEPYEPPDVTTRFAVAELEKLNDKVSELTENATTRTEAVMERVYDELRRLTSLREVDLTEQAVGIFGAVQAANDSLAAFSTVVKSVTNDLKTILEDSLKSIGGTEGLAAWVAASAADLAETRQEFAASLGKIERDVSLLRRRARDEAKKPVFDDEQLTFIVEAVTEGVLSALDTGKRRR